MDSTLFRSAVEAQPQESASEEKFPISDKAHPIDEMPPSLYREAHKVPLVLDLIGGSSAYRHFDMTLLTNEVDRYISEEISRLGLEDSKNEYQQVLNKALDTLKLPEGTDVYAMVEKLVRHFRIQNKLYTALREKEELMMADPASLSAPKLKLYLERNHGIS